MKNYVQYVYCNTYAYKITKNEGMFYFDYGQALIDFFVHYLLKCYGIQNIHSGIDGEHPWCAKISARNPI